MATQEVRIVDGPSHWSLILALNDRQEVKFTLEGVGEVSADLDTMSRLDVFAGEWRIQGAFYWKDVFNAPHFRHRFEGVYGVRSRLGRVEINLLGPESSGPASLALLERQGLTETGRAALARKLGI